MISYGLLVEEWPLVLGSDAVGLVEELGHGAEKYGFKVGDYVIGSSRLGYTQYSTGQEHYLKDAMVTIKKPDNITPVEAATLGTGALTAGLGIWIGLNVPLPAGDKVAQSDEWAIVFGGAGSVGRCAVQILVACGFKVIATASSRSTREVSNLGATAVDYKQSAADQVEEILRISGGKFTRIFDATSAPELKVAQELFSKVTGDKFLTTTGQGSVDNAKTHSINLGMLGRPGQDELNAGLRKQIPIIERLIETGQLVPQAYEIVGEGLDAIVQAHSFQQSGRGGNKKVLVQIQGV
jgi:NADPH:quinone reductase-like Zn-dependent oxidoreductase